MKTRLIAFQDFPNESAARAASSGMGNWTTQTLEIPDEDTPGDLLLALLRADSPGGDETAQRALLDAQRAGGGVLRCLGCMNSGSLYEEGTHSYTTSIEIYPEDAEWGDTECGESTVTGWGCWNCSAEFAHTSCLAPSLCPECQSETVLVCPSGSECFFGCTDSMCNWKVDMTDEQKQWLSQHS